MSTQRSICSGPSTRQRDRNGAPAWPMGVEAVPQRRHARLQVLRPGSDAAGVRTSRVQAEPGGARLQLHGANVFMLDEMEHAGARTAHYPGHVRGGCSTSGDAAVLLVRLWSREPGAPRFARRTARASTAGPRPTCALEYCRKRTASRPKAPLPELRRSGRCRLGRPQERRPR